MLIRGRAGRNGFASPFAGKAVSLHLKLADMNQADAAKLVEQMIAVLPVGATEVHGDHIPLGTDSYLADALCRRLEERMGTDKILILPCVPYGQVWSLRAAKGTVDSPDSVLTPYLVNIAKSLYRAGVRRFAFVNAHVGNNNSVKAAMRQIWAETDMKVYGFTYPGAESAIREVCTTKRAHGAYFHACEIETSYMLYLCPERVEMSRAVCQYPEFPADFDATPIPWTDFMETAVLGDATAADAEKGRYIIDRVIENMARILGQE